MVERLGEEVEDDDGVPSAAELTLQELASIAGLAQENMNRAAGWRFFDMGRRAERAINTARFARQFAFDEAGEEDLDILLTLVDCQITYRSRYLVGPSLAPVRDLAVLDPYNPRSVAFQVAALNDHIAALPSLKQHGLIERPQRLAVALQATLTTAEAATLDVKTLFALEQDLPPTGLLVLATVRLPDEVLVSAFKVIASAASSTLLVALMPAFTVIPVFCSPLCSPKVPMLAGTVSAELTLTGPVAASPSCRLATVTLPISDCTNSRFAGFFGPATMFIVRPAVSGLMLKLPAFGAIGPEMSAWSAKTMSLPALI